MKTECGEKEPINQPEQGRTSVSDEMTQDQGPYRAYVDTSVFGGVQDREFARPTGYPDIGIYTPQEVLHYEEAL